MTRQYSIRELVDATGIPRRTIRYYVQRGLIPAPEGAGRGHFYTETHRARLGWIRGLQARGHRLDEIAELIDAEERDSSSVDLRATADRPWLGPMAAAQPDALISSRVADSGERAFADRAQSSHPDRAPSPRIEPITRIHLAEGVELSFTQPARVPSPARLREIALAVARLLEH